MDYLEYKDFLAHARGSFGASIKKRLAGAKKAGSQMLANATGGGSGSGSVGGRSGRKWKNHKYIAIINGRYIYPAKRALKQTLTKEGRQAKRLALVRSEGTAHERAAIAQKKYQHEYKNAENAANEVRKVGKVKNKQSRDYGAAVQRKTEAEARRDKHLSDSSKYILEREKHAKALAKLDRTEDTINRLRSAMGKEANASSKVAEPRKRKVLSKKEQRELNQQAIDSANEYTSKNAPKQKKKKAEPKKTSEFKKSIKEIADYAGNKIKSGNITFGPDPEKLSQAILEQKKKRKKK